MVALAGAGGASTAVAQTEDMTVDLELVLSVDVSWSMDFAEQRLQREGYVAAFRHPDLIRAITSGIHGRIAVTYMEWAGALLQEVVVPWTVIDSVDAAEAFASKLEVARPGRRLRTSISSALLFAAGLFDGNGYRGFQRVIDVSGDGPNNQGVPVTQARDAVVAQGIVINGLPIQLHWGGTFDIKDLDIYYEDCVIGGLAAFTVSVDDVSELAEAIRRKLVLEIAGRPPTLIPASNRAPRIDCLIGEKLWGERQFNSPFN